MRRQLSKGFSPMSENGGSAQPRHHLKHDRRRHRLYVPQQRRPHRS